MKINVINQVQENDVSHKNLTTQSLLIFGIPTCFIHHHHPQSNHADYYPLIFCGFDIY